MSARIAVGEGLMSPHAAPRVQGVFGVGEGLARARSAADDLSWLLSRDHSITAALKLTGDRHQLDARQRIAMRGSAGTRATSMTAVTANGVCR